MKSQIVERGNRNRVGVSIGREPQIVSTIEKGYADSRRVFEIRDRILLNQQTTPDWTHLRACERAA